MIEIDRMALVFQPKKEFIDWLKSINEEDDLSGMTLITEPTVVLIPIIENEDEFNDYIKENYSRWLDYELSSWCSKEALLPKKRDLEAFQSYFDIHVHSLVIDNLNSEYLMSENMTLQ